MDLATLFVRLQADVSDFEKKMGRVRRTVSQTGEALQGLGRTLTIGVTAPLTALAAVSLKAAADFDSLSRGLEAVTGSAAEAGRQFEQLREIAKLPAVDLQQAAQTSIALQSIGESAEFAERMIRGVANAVALSGGGAAQFEGVVRQLRQVASLGRLMGEELNVILENAPAMAKALQNAFGTTSAEAIRALNLSTEEFFERLFRGMEELPQVAGGAANSFDNLRQSLQQAAAVIGGQLLPAVLPLVEGLAAALENMQQIDPETVRWGISLAAVAAVAGPLAIVIGQMATAAQAFAAALSVGILPLIGVGGAVIVGLGALSALFVKTKLDALAAAGAYEEAARALQGLSKADLQARRNDLQGQLDTGLREGTLREPALLRLRVDILKIDNQLAALGTTAGGAGNAITSNITAPLTDAQEAARELVDTLREVATSQLFARHPSVETLQGRDRLAGALAGSTGGLDLRPRNIVDPANVVGQAAPAGAIGQFFGALQTQITGLVASFGPLAAAAAELAPVFQGLRAAAELAPVFQGLREALGPALEALAEPLRIVGRLLGAVIAPVLISLEPVLTALGFAAAFVVEAWGRMIKAIGDVINALLPFSPGQRLVNWGTEMIEASKDAQKALRGAGEAADELASSMTNVPIVFARALRTFQASTGGIGGGSGGGFGAGGGWSGGTPGGGPTPFRPSIVIQNATFNGVNDFRDFAKQAEEYGTRIEWRAGYNPLAVLG